MYTVEDNKNTTELVNAIVQSDPLKWRRVPQYSEGFAHALEHVASGMIVNLYIKPAEIRFRTTTLVVKDEANVQKLTAWYYKTQQILTDWDTQKVLSMLN